MIHEIFDIPKGPGLSDVLLGRADPAQAIQTTPLLPGLFILTAGQSARQVVPMLSQGRIPAFLKTLRSQYDYIVVDSSPVLPVADALLVGQHVDGVVFSIRPHFSQHPSVEAAYERLRAMRIKVVGAVVNGVPATISPYEYRYLSSSTS
jgi:Mrp family chromosome partitioning ATPase